MMSKKITGICVSALLVAMSPAWAGDLSTDVRKGASDPHAGDGNYIELGIGLIALTSPYYGLPAGNTHNAIYGGLNIDLNMHFQYKGFFMEGFSQSLEQFTLGYHFADGERWSLDAVALEQHAELSDKVSRDLKGLKTRQGDYMSGLRATEYYDNYIVQLHALTDISETHNGQVYSVKLARHWQYKNWNFHAIQSASYRTEAVADYYLSIKPEDATETFPAFHAQAGFTHVSEIGATYPLSQKWVYRGYLRHIELNHQWTGSPLLISGHGNVFMNSFDYVF